MKLSMDLWHSSNIKVILCKFAKDDCLNTELCWWHFLFLYWFFPYGSQSSQIISENFILKFLKNMIKPLFLWKGSYKISPVHQYICLSVCLWNIFLMIYSVDVLNFLHEDILPYILKRDKARYCRIFGILTGAALLFVL